jgi:hypothetical protein
MSKVVNSKSEGFTAERRWIVLAPDGRYVTIGRHSDPSDQDISQIETDLSNRGLSGWLAIMDGNPWDGRLPTLMMVKPIAQPSTAFTEAAERFIAGIAKSRSSLDA